MVQILRGCFLCSTITVFFAALGLAALQQTIWWASYDFRNCEYCGARIDWPRQVRNDVSDLEKQQYVDDGVVIMKGAMLGKTLIEELSKECDRIPNTFMTSILANFILKFYLRYEHRLETRSELLRDWAVHGPFGKWAAQFLGVEEVRLYNSELIFHRGDESPTCKPAWHRDSVAAPFDPDVPSAVFNVYLHDIDADHDGLIYVRGSHQDPGSMPENIEIIKPQIAVGDVLVHSANSYHTTSGRGCWKRRSLQFRYFAAVNATFSHGPMRQAGPIPWTFAHAPGVAPHGLQVGDTLEGPWYPRVHPKILESEQGSVPNAQPWGLFSLGSFIMESAGHMNDTRTGKPSQGVIVMDGVVRDPEDWEHKMFGEADSGIFLPMMKKAANVAAFYCR